MTNHQNIRRHSMRDAIRPSVFATLILAACDTNVTNPGPVNDEFLFDRNAASAMVSGAGRALSSGINWISYTSASITREIHPAGSTGSFGITTLWQNGTLSQDDGEERLRAAYGTNYNQLVALKSKYDPTNLFRVNQNIKPVG